MNDLLIFLSFAAFVLSPCVMALRSRDQREEARLGGKLGPRLVPARVPASRKAPRKVRKLIVDSLPTTRNATLRESRGNASTRHTGPRAAYAPSASPAPGRRRKDGSLFIPPARQVPTLGYTSAPVPALVYGLPHTSTDDLLLLVLPGSRAPQARPLRFY